MLRELEPPDTEKEKEREKEREREREREKVREREEHTVHKKTTPKKMSKWTESFVKQQTRKKNKSAEIRKRSSAENI
jgi:transcriptional adapter 2-alpha